MAFTGTLTINTKGTLTNPLDLSTPQDDVAHKIALAIASGTGSGQAQQMWSDNRTLAATTETLDLAGVLTNGLGQTVSFATVRYMVIYNKATTAGYDLTIGGAAANGFIAPFADATDKIKVRAGGCLVLAAPIDGYTVTAGTADQLKLDSGANSVNYDIILIGT